MLYYRFEKHHGDLLLWNRQGFIAHIWAALSIYTACHFSDGTWETKILLDVHWPGYKHEAKDPYIVLGQYRLKWHPHCSQCKVKGILILNNREVYLRESRKQYFKHKSCNANDCKMPLKFSEWSLKSFFVFFTWMFIFGTLTWYFWYQ